MRTFISIMFIILSVHSFGQSKSEKLDRKLIVGKWMSVEDKKYTIVVTKSYFIEYYDKKKTGKYSYKIENGKLTKIGVDDGNVLEYDIMNLTKKHLSVMYLVRGNLLEFNRIK